MKTIGELIDAGVISRETKVIGSVPLTKDGVWIGDDCVLWFPDDGPWNVELFRSTEEEWIPFLVNKAYSTERAAQAALAAKETKYPGDQDENAKQAWKELDQIDKHIAAKEPQQ